MLPISNSHARSTVLSGPLETLGLISLLYLMISTLRLPLDVPFLIIPPTLPYHPPTHYLFPFFFFFPPPPPAPPTCGTCFSAAATTGIAIPLPCPSPAPPSAAASPISTSPSSFFTPLSSSLPAALPANVPSICTNLPTSCALLVLYLRLTPLFGSNVVITKCPFFPLFSSSTTCSGVADLGVRRAEERW